MQTKNINHELQSLTEAKRATESSNRKINDNGGGTDQRTGQLTTVNCQHQHQNQALDDHRESCTSQLRSCPRIRQSKRFPSLPALGSHDLQQEPSGSPLIASNSTYSVTLPRKKAMSTTVGYNQVSQSRQVSQPDVRSLYYNYPNTVMKEGASGNAGASTDIIGPNEFYETASSSTLPRGAAFCQRSVSSPMLNTVSQSSTLPPGQQLHQQFPAQYPQAYHKSTHHIHPGTLAGLEEEVDLNDVCSTWLTREIQPGSRPLPLIGKSCSQQSPQLLHNLKPNLYEKVAPKEVIVQQSNEETTHRVNHVITSNTSTGASPKRAEAQRSSNPHGYQNATAMEEKHVVVVSRFDADNSNLVVSSQQQTSEMLLSEEVSAHVEAKHYQSERVASSSSQEMAYKSSSESGRGTMSSDTQSVKKSSGEVNNIDNSSLDSDQSGSNRQQPKSWESQQKQPQPQKQLPSSTSNIIEHMQQELQRILDGGAESECDQNRTNRLPVVLESDSWLSDSTQSGKGYPENKSNATKKAKQMSKTQTETSRAPGYATVIRNGTRNEKTNSSLKPVKPLRASMATATGKESKTATSIATTTAKERYPVKPPRRWRPPADDAASTTTGGLDSVADFADDAASECTALTLDWDMDTSTKKQLTGLESMYSQILTLLNTNMKTAKKNAVKSSSGYKPSSRKRCASVASSVASKTSYREHSHRRGTRDEIRQARLDDSMRTSNLRIAKLESHVVTLARSVAQLSAEIRTSHTLIQEMERMRSEVARIENQMKVLKTSSLHVENTSSLRRNGVTNKQHTMESTTNGKHMDKKGDTVGNSKEGRFDKLKRFFGDEPPALKQFLKKLGYEKYTSKFESEKITINELVYLNEERLQKLGIPMGPRIRILQEASKLKPSQTGNIYLV